MAKRMQHDESDGCGGREQASQGHLMTDNEWENFWALLDAKRQRMDAAEQPPLDDQDDAEQTQNEDEVSSDEYLEEEKHFKKHNVEDAETFRAPHADRSLRTKAGRTNRCGTCAACRAKDCGKCKNCLDKPRFGGPGIKKKACVSRVCRNTMQPSHHSRDGESDLDISPATSPTLQPCNAALPPSLNLVDSYYRQPLVPLEMKPIPRYVPVNVMTHAISAARAH
uniref:CXXC-type domain-containing protein n=1 Tax=Chrysotila carterae TaxID=13221 RepID=A0A7S4BY51_CHRCT|mmetsp:Transcript_31583/g.60746  ORF Transcript_31583/g.60746 Transcript_31583/m.60746 type:complete len:224 (-) Transcript_31583:658-1329(-)